MIYFFIAFSLSVCEGLMASMGDETSNLGKCGAKFVLNDLIPGSTPIQAHTFLAAKDRENFKGIKVPPPQGCIFFCKVSIVILVHLPMQIYRTPHVSMWLVNSAVDAQGR